MEMFENWKYEDFIALLYLYVASADYHIANEELDFIQTNLKKITGEDVSPVKLIEANMKFSRMSDIQVIDALYELREKFCKSKDECDKVMYYVNKLIQADNKITTQELQVQMFLRRLFKNEN